MDVVAEFPLTPAAVRAAREVAGFTTPIEPVREGDRPWCIFEQRGTYEFLLHPVDALDYIMHGMMVDGRRFPVSYIDSYPMVGAWHVLVVDPDANKSWLK